MVYDQDTSWATLVTHFFKQQTSTFSAAPDSILGSINRLPVPYGKETTDRPVQDPETIVMGSKQWDGRRAKKVTLKQNVDLINLGDGIEIPRADFAADPEGARIWVRDTGRIFRDAIEKTMIEGISNIAVGRGISDFPDGTSGTVNRPEIAYNNTASNDWKTTANMRTDIINMLVGLVAKRFYGPYLILAPSIVRPMLSEVISNTAQPINTWLKTSAGVRIAFSPYVHEAATKDAFNVYLIDTSKVHLGISPIQFDAWYEKKDHAYYWDWETYMACLCDPLYDGSEYLKGVAQTLSIDWSD